MIIDDVHFVYLCLFVAEAAMFGLGFIMGKLCK